MSGGKPPYENINLLRLSESRTHNIRTCENVSGRIAVVGLLSKSRILVLVQTRLKNCNDINDVYGWHPLITTISL